MKIFNYNGKKLCDYIVYTNDENKHIAIFRDANNIIQEVEISDIIKEALISEKLKEKRQQNQFDRHIEHSEIYENRLNSRVLDKTKSLEEQLENKIINQNLRDAISSLSEVQKRRIKMYYFENMTQQEIADKEGVSLRAVQYTLNDALEELKKIARESSNKEEFKDRVKERFSEYSGLNYLDMTADFFFPNNK